ncbi:MAG: hypothetical protein ACM3PA_00055, partial [Methanomassiliicoccales archaeon]
SSTRAQNAAEELKSKGLVPEPGAIQVDRVSRFGETTDANYNSPINNANSLSALTLHSSGRGDLSPLLAADPSASGISDSGYGVAGGHAFLLTLVTGEENVKTAVDIIKQNGGQI